MSKVVIIGAGGVGRVAAHKCSYQLIFDSDYRAMDAFGTSYENKGHGKLPVS